MRKSDRRWASVVVCWVASLSAAERIVAAEPTNVVLIMTDNHGAWTLGCYGNPEVRTPNIDRLASEGLRFTRAFASNAVCSPTRATYLTGLLPSQHGVHCFLRAGEWQTGPEARCTIAEFPNLSKILAARGYHCGLVGKWHLGGNMTPQEGFRDWVTMPHGATSTFYNAEVIDEGRVRKEPKYLTDFWTDRAVSFLEQNHERPFFLFLAYNGPYGLGKLLLEPSRNRHTEYYAGKLLLSFDRGVMHPWLFNNKEYLNNPVSIRRYASEISGVDDGVGRVMETLGRLGLDRNTLVVFCADQGLMAGENGIWGMGDHTRPLGAFDGMMQVPLIFRQPRAIAAGCTTDLLVSNYDFLPSLLGYLGIAGELGEKPRSPGRDYAPVLRGEKIDWDPVVFYEMETTRAVRTDDWKYVDRLKGPGELYDLRSDPHEKFNRFGQAGDRAVQANLAERLAHFFDTHADPQYDLYHGGGSKTKLLSD
ncbi:MAG TPA: sulfatase-like hydrolase/transferase [Pirellulales bacterium]|jgi:arylsulfatase A-like enzyme|nr:sulfatase-like hydrolase/transferase [Pirellulales bacterium]